MTKKILLLFFLATTLCLCSCSKEQPEYEWETKTKEEIVSLYHERNDELQSIAEILIFSKKNFYPNACVNGSNNAWIQSPYDEEKMYYFNEDEKKLLQIL